VPVNPRSLQEQLRQLHDAIEKVDKVDDRGRDLLRDLDGHIRDLLARSESGATRARPEFAAGLQDAVRHFEVTHPDLTLALSELLTTLSNAGI
jgi:hypothetical protein